MIADDLTTDGEHEPWCALRYDSDPGLNASVWIGFDPTFLSYCQLDNDGKYSLAYPTTHPTTDPIVDSTYPIADPTNAPTADPTHRPTPVPLMTRNATPEPTRDPTSAPTSSPSNDRTPSMFPTNEPTDDSTTASPTQYTIVYSEFDSAISAIFNITGWTTMEISKVNDDIQSFASDLTIYIHHGFNNDPHLEFRDVVPNISTINDYTVDQLIEGDDSGILRQSIYSGMKLQYLIRCHDNFDCEYIRDNRTGGMNRSIFEQFVSDKLNVHFKSTDASIGSLKFTIESISNQLGDHIASTSTDSSFHLTTTTLLLILLAVIPLFICISIFCWRRFRNHSSLSVSNASVVMIGIGDYSDGPKLSRASKEVSGTLINLDVTKDIESLRNLCKYMNWTFHSKPQKVHWTEKEIVYFLEHEIGELMFTANGTLNFDGLIICISCHGIRNKIVTSDFKTIDETAIHRMVSLKFPKLRDIPRMFVYDCCDGSDDRRATIDLGDDRSKDIMMEMMENRKGTDLDDVQNLTGNVWTSKTKNPDYNLVIVKAANSGFAAKFNNECGSYVVYFLTMAIRRNVEKRQGRTLAEILEHVQNKLHDHGKQQTVNQTNNHTRTLVFKKNPKK